MKKIYTLGFAIILTLTAQAQLWNIATGPSGIPLHTNIAGTQDQQALCVTSVRDGIIYAWRDNRTGSNGQDIWIQKYTLCGTPVWANSGVMICNSPNNQVLPQICNDGNDGAIIVWEDNRLGNADIYAQHVTGQGLITWLLNGIPIGNGTGNQQVPQIIADGNGGAIIAWEDNRSGNYDIYAQRVSAAGNALWSGNGYGVCIQTGNEVDVALASDSANGAFIVWEDARTTNLGIDIYAQHMSPTGVPLWTANGINLANNSGNQTDPCVAYTLNNTVTFAWADPSGSGETINAVKLTSLGVACTGWTLPDGNISGNAITSSGNPGTAARPKIAADKLGGCYISYRSNYSSGDKDILTSWMNANGTQNTCVGSCNTNVEMTAYFTDVEDNHDITPDGCGGAVNTYEQRAGPTMVGYRKYGTSNIYASSGTGARDNPFIAALCGVDYIVWQDQRTGTLGGDDLYVGGTSDNSPPALLNSSITPTLPNSACCVAPMTPTSCFGTNITFTCALPGGLFNNFKFYDGTTLLQNSSSNVYSTSALSVGVHGITVVASTTSGCQTASSNLINVTILALPTITPSILSAPICAGTTTSLSVTGGVSYVWNPGNLSGSSISITPTTTTTYTVVGTDANGCTNSATTTVTVNPLPIVTASAASSPICVTLTTDALSGTPTGGNFTGTGVTGSNFDPSVAGIGSHTVWYHFTDVNGCTDSSSTVISVSACTGLGTYTSDIRFEIYPNPFTDNITVQFAQADAYDVEITNVLGEIVYSAVIKTQKSVIQLSALQAGVYFIKISSGSGSSTKKMVKE